MLNFLFPVQASKLGKIKDVHTCVLLHRIHSGEIATVLEVPESGVVHTRQWVGERWRTLRKSTQDVLTYA
jgi:hypothetical protein